MKTQEKGFTLIELLIVVAIIGLLATISVLVLNGARAKSRDAKRVSDIQVVRAGLEQHWLEKASYPVSSPTALGVGNAIVLTSNGFEAAATGAVYLPRVPIGPKSGETYQYEGNAAGYAIRFTTEGTTTYGTAATYFGHSNGVDTDPGLK